MALIALTAFGRRLMPAFTVVRVVSTTSSHSSAGSGWPVSGDWILLSSPLRMCGV